MTLYVLIGSDNASVGLGIYDYGIALREERKAVVEAIESEGH